MQINEQADGFIWLSCQLFLLFFPSWLGKSSHWSFFGDIKDIKNKSIVNCSWLKRKILQKATIYLFSASCNKLRSYLYFYLFKLWLFKFLTICVWSDLRTTTTFYLQPLTATTLFTKVPQLSWKTKTAEIKFSCET